MNMIITVVVLAARLLTVHDDDDCPRNSKGVNVGQGKMKSKVDFRWSSPINS